MATQGGVIVKVTSYNNLKFSWEVASYSVANNSTTINWKLELTADANGRISSTASKVWSVTIDGEKKTGTNTVGIAASSTKTLASGSKEIKHNNDGSKTFSYSFTQEFNITFSGTKINTKGGSATAELEDVPIKATIKTAENFNDEANPAITYINPAGTRIDSLQACIASIDAKTIYVPYRNISKTGTSYTFVLTDAERKTLRKAVTNKNGTLGVKFYVRTIVDGISYYSSLQKTLSLINYTPTFTYTFTDDNLDTYHLTGDTSTFVKYASYVSYAIFPTARKEATITSCKVTCGSQTKNGVHDSFTNIESGDFTITVTDSRGSTTTKTVSNKFINYIKPTCNLTARAELAENNTTTVKFTIKGDFYSGSFGAAYNTITTQYRVKEAGEEWGAWSEPVYENLYNNSYDFYGTIANLDYQKAYTIQARVIDALNTNGVLSVERTVKAIPIFDWGENDFNFNVPVTVNGLNLSGAAKALTNSYNLDTTGTTAGDGWTNGGFAATLLGNNLRCTYSVTRGTATGDGNITNETVLNVKIKHSGKIKAFYQTSIISGGTGGVAVFAITDATNDGEYIEFKMNIAATASAITSSSGGFSQPVLLNLDAY